MIKDQIGLHSVLLSLLIAFIYTLPFGNYKNIYSPKVMVYSAKKPFLTLELSEVNLMFRTLVLLPPAIILNPELEPLSWSIILPELSVNSTKS